MRSLLIVCLLSAGMAVAQNESSPAPDKAQSPSNSSSSPEKKPSPRKPNLAPPRSDSGTVDASSIPDDGNSSSKQTQIDISPPPNDAKDHPQSSEILMDESGPAGDGTNEFHPWDPHKAAKDIEVGDFYFKRKNYRAAEDRYREALYYKDNDALATYHLAECLEKLDRPEDAKVQYENYLKILPYGPEAENAKKAIARLKGSAASAKPTQ